MNETATGQGQPRSPGEAGKSVSSPKRQAILVLGMHRSGTSAVGGVVNALGAAAPKTMLKPDEGNPRGFFESAHLAVAHNSLLASAGSYWHDWRKIEPSWFQSEAAGRHRQAIRQLLVDEFGDQRLIFVKDPRICRFVPFMSSILAELNYDPIAILPIRNPLEVAYSLGRRNEFALSKSVLLWLRHVLDAEFYSRDKRRCLLSYEGFLTDWRREMARIAEQTGLAWPDRSEGSDLKVDEFLTDDLHRERIATSELGDHADVAPWARETYDILVDFAAAGESSEALHRLDIIRTKFDEACGMFGPLTPAEELAGAYDGLLAERDVLATAHNGLIVDHDKLARNLDGLTAERDALALTRDGLISERDAIAHDRSSLAAERDALAAARDGLISERDAIALDRNNLTAERDALEATCNSLGAARDAMLASRSWRLTAPLRSLSRMTRRNRTAHGLRKDLLR
jgi:hypothetical protein